MKPDTCRSCGFYGDGKGFVPDRPVESRVAVLAQNPGADEEMGRKVVGYSGGTADYTTWGPEPLIGKTGYDFANKWLPLAQLDRDDVSLHNVLKCRLDHKNTLPPPFAVSFRDAAKTCSQYLTLPDTVEVVVAMGAHAFSVMGGSRLRVPKGGGGERPATIYDYRGYTLPDLYHGRTVYCVLHPADLYREHDMVVPSRMDWRRLHKLLDGEWPKAIPSRVVAGDSVAAIQEAFATAWDAPRIYVDTEFVYDDPEREGLLTLIGVGWKLADGTIEFVAGVQLEWLSKDVTSEVRREFIRHFAALAKQKPVGMWNMKADLPVIKQNLHVTVDHPFDPMLMHSVQWSELPHDLEFVASISGEYTKLKHLSRTDPLLYNWGDVIETVEIGEKLWREADYEPRFYTAYGTKVSLTPIIMRREAEGLRVNKPLAESMIPTYQERIAEAERMALAYIGWPETMLAKKKGGRASFLLSSGKTGLFATWLKACEGLTLASIGKDDIADARNAVLPFDPDDEKHQITLPYVSERIDQGAHPLLELRAMKSKSSQIMNFYLKPLMVDNGE